MPSAIALDARDAGESAATQDTVRSRTAALPWYMIAMAVGATSIVVGVNWDISWHRTIGRDTFWTPAHMAIYLGGLIAGLGGGWVALRQTFGRAGESATVRFWGFRAPLGAWVAIWGAIAMLTSAPFDDWWHNAYGLDVKIISPPHMVLALGIFGVVVGALLLALAQQNRDAAAVAAASGPTPWGGRLAFLYGSGLLVTIMGLLTLEYTRANHQHSSRFYIACCVVFPLVLAAAGRAGRLRWPTTSAAAVYMLMFMASIWILPLFHAQPMLGPIYNPVDHMVPPSFPVLLVVPALAMDVLLARFGRHRDWLLTVALAVAFLGVLLAVQWFFSAFLMSPAAENWFFGSDRNWGYNNQPGEWRFEYWGEPLSLMGLAAALAAALLSTRLGLWWGSWMARVRR